MKLMIYTQYSENYGTIVAPYWKMKGSYEYVITNVSTSTEDLARTEKAAAALINYMNEDYEEWVIGCELVEDDYLTDFEKSQLECDGHITYPTKELILGETA